MNMHYDENIWRGYLIQGKLKKAVSYLKPFEDQKERYDKYISLFEDQEYMHYGLPEPLESILLGYQICYRDIFWLEYDQNQAEKKLLHQLNTLLHLNIPTMDEMEEQHLSQVFEENGYHCLAGRTGKWCGPYVWKTTQETTYDVQIPEGIQKYTVVFMDGFVFRSWLAYLSFDIVGTGGWADDQGRICCVKSAYDIDSQSFQISLLKHEAQHQYDYVHYSPLPSATLEYRAKLVELMYTTDRNLLPSFLMEADATSKENGHAAASEMIRKGFTQHTEKPLQDLSIPEVQSIASLLFAKNRNDLKSSRIEKRSA